MRILGIDPGLKSTGYGVIDVIKGEPRLLEGGIFRTNSKNPLGIRLQTIFNDVVEILREYEPEVVVIEDLYSKGMYPRTSILMAHVRGVVCLAAAVVGIPVVSYTASRIKRAVTGSGRAGKEQIQRAIQKLLGLKQIAGPPDVADALALALGHYYVITRGVKTK